MASNLFCAALQRRRNRTERTRPSRPHRRKLSFQRLERRELLTAGVLPFSYDFLQADADPSHGDTYVEGGRPLGAVCDVFAITDVEFGATSRASNELPTDDDAVAIGLAIAAADAAECAVVLVPKGIYDVQTSISLTNVTNVAIVGTVDSRLVASHDSDVFVWGNLDASTGEPLAQQVEIADLSISGDFQRAFSLGPASQVIIRDNRIVGAKQYGIYMNNVTNVEVLRNSILPTSEGAFPNASIFVDTAGASSLEIKGNELVGAMQFGIGLYNTSNSRIVNNTVTQVVGVVDANSGLLTNNGYGIMTYGIGMIDPYDFKIENNTIQDNDVSDTGGTGIYVQAGRDTTVRRNRVFNTALDQVDGSLLVGGIAVNAFLNADGLPPEDIYLNNRIAQNVVVGGGKAGITFQGRGVSVENNFIADVDQRAGIVIRGASDSVVRNNGVIGGRAGIRDWGSPSSDLRIVNNVIQDVATHGIEMTNTHGSVLIGNEIEGAEIYGISLGGSNNLVFHNDVSDVGSYAFYIGTKSSIFIHNTVIDSRGGGGFLENSLASNNVFWRNIVISQPDNGGIRSYGLPSDFSETGRNGAAVAEGARIADAAFAAGLVGAGLGDPRLHSECRPVSPKPAAIASRMPRVSEL